ncbi:hypothetical protein [Thalassospira lucentensis]|uniref:hypothetical protein n=1 Tax=Thalassospira lucentensis TaxID=168935 RepID=UPI0029437C4B|nr:hypothetical protein [Thalassospira lucentensis]WOI11813.1 hypothetical protein R1T41_04345 [Thalassospira lucentensis]
MRGKDFELAELKVTILENGMYRVADDYSGIVHVGKKLDEVIARVTEEISIFDSSKKENGKQISGEPNKLPKLNIGSKLFFLIPMLLCFLIALSSFDLMREVVTTTVSGGPNGNSVFSHARRVVISLDQALQNITPEAKSEILNALHGISVSLRPYIEEMRPLLSDGLSVQKEGDSE